MSVGFLRLKLLSLFAGTALVLPSTAYLAVGHGWDVGTAGVVIGCMTVLAVLCSPLWGQLDDRRNGLGLQVASALASGSTVLLWVSAQLTAFDETFAIPLLLIFGAASGGIEPLMSARIQRANLMGRYPSIRVFGTGGWIIGLVAASVLVAIDQGDAVYLVAGACFATLLFMGRSPSAERRTTTPTGWHLPRRVILFILLGLPVPISAYVYLIYSPSGFDVLFAAESLTPYGALIALAILEIPAFGLVQRLTPGRRLAPTYVIMLVLLTGSWFLLLLGGGTTVLSFVALVSYSLSGALWASLQVNIVRELSSAHRAGLHQAITSSYSKCLSAVVSGLVVGWILSRSGEAGAALFVLSISGLALLAAAVTLPFSRQWNTLSFPANAPSTIER